MHDGSGVIPLFPLGSVFMPDQLIPLHIFEPRYRSLVDDLLSFAQTSSSPDDVGFGVISIKVGRETGVDGVHALHAVGTFAVLGAVKAYDDGRFDIVARGAGRFRPRSLTTTASGYLQGEVDWLTDEEGNDALRKADTVRQLHEMYQHRIATTLDRPREDEPQTPRSVSYQVPASMVLTNDDLQAVLETNDDSGRLSLVARLLRRELALWDAMHSLPDVTAARSPIVLN